MEKKRHQIQKNDIQIHLHTRKKDMSYKLDLHGFTVEEGISAVEYYLDKAFIYGMSPVHLVHGHGTGKLRKAIRAYLSTNPHVSRFAPSDPHSGGDGSTTVYLENNALE